jgi:predicted O-methyltransferase YrrM
MTKPGIQIRYTHYDRKLLPNRFVASKDRGKRMETAIKNTGYSIGYPGWNLIYYITFCSLDRDGPNTILETGTNWGFSTIMLAQALIDSGLQGHIHTVELRQAHYSKACRHIREAQVSDVVTAHLADSVRFLDEFVAELDGTIRTAFIDASHVESDVVREFELIYPKLASESTVMFDNTYRIAEDGEEDQRVNGALHRITKRFGGNLVNFPNCSWFTPGLAVWQKAPFAKDWT